MGHSDATIADNEEYPLVDIGGVEIKPESDSLFLLKSPLGVTLLEFEAASSRQCEYIVLSIREAISELTDQSYSKPTPRRTKKAKADKVLYFAQKDVELTQRKEAAEKKKAQILGTGGGMKYTALAMAGAFKKSSTSDMT